MTILLIIFFCLLYIIGFLITYIGIRVFTKLNYKNLKEPILEEVLGAVIWPLFLLGALAQYLLSFLKFNWVESLSDQIVQMIKGKLS